MTQEQMMGMIQEVTGLLTLLLGAIASISLIVGSIGIMNIMLVSVTERTREIGIRKAVGAKRRDILLQFLLEAAMLSLSGGAVGIIGGWAVSWLISTFSEAAGLSIHAAVTADIIGLAISVSVFIGLISGIYPAMRAARLNPIDALHYE
jgi:putative ABC transport system permease protein